MSLPYTTNPKTYHELLDAVRGQLERSREMAMMGKPMRFEDKVIITPEAFMGLLDKVEELQQVVVAHTTIFDALQHVLFALFEATGIPVEDFFDVEDEEDESD